MIPVDGLALFGPGLLLPPTMNTFKKSTLIVLLLSLGAVVGGCSTRAGSKSAIPWSQPAQWEGQIPGMGQTTGR